ncbi:MAG: hypothetical protein JNM52_02665 [Betaproteobacteria bacterium]|nr:hypothetical protein [Betaproteobacteria bacterium]
MAKKTYKVIEPIDSTLDRVSKAIVAPHIKYNKINRLYSEKANLPPGPYQHELFHIDTQVEFEDVEMGVLENGTPYLSGRGLSRLCGIDHKTLHEISFNWSEQRLKPRGRAIEKLLESSGYSLPELYIKAEYNGLEVNAFTEPACMAILEYYAFEASDKKDQASRAFRRLAREGMRQFVYSATGYKPETKALDSWKHFHDRVDMTIDAVPLGYFSVFREIAAMIVPMIRAGVMISDRVVPDISVGKAWSSYWEENKLSISYGERTKYDHEYPLYYPASKSNPQPSFAYPDSALGVFRSWLRLHYIVTKFPAYLLGQTKKGTVPLSLANKTLEAFGGNKIEHKSDK